MHKNSATVRGAILEMLGVVAASAPGTVAHNPTTAELPVQCLTVLKKNINSAKPEMRVIVGALRCLNACLGDFSRGFEPQSQRTGEMYSYLQRLSEIPRENDEERVRTLDVQRAVCEVLRRHAPLMRMYLADDYKTIFLRLNAVTTATRRYALFM